MNLFDMMPDHQKLVVKIDFDAIIRGSDEPVFAYI